MNTLVRVTGRVPSSATVAGSSDSQTLPNSVAKTNRSDCSGDRAIVTTYCVPETWATVGSSNLDALSLMLNNEANVVLVRYDAVTNELRDAIAAAFADGREIDPARFAARPRIERMLNWLAYTAYRLVMKALTVGGYD